jgi:uncharacterized DUF497 family protein
MDDVFYSGQFVWNRRKNELNKQRHGISFETGSEVFFKPFVIIEYDEMNSINEDRYNATAYIDGYSCVTVTFTERNGLIRIISARKADSEERGAYYDKLREAIGTR